MLYKGRVVFRQNIPKKHKRFGIKIYKLCDYLGYTYDMNVYLGKQQQHATAQITAMHSMVLQLFEEWRDWATKFSWTITSPRLQQNDAQKFPSNSHSQIDYPFARWKCDSYWHFKGQTKSSCIPAQSTGSKTFTALAFQRKTAVVPHVLAAQANTEHNVFLQEVWHWSVRSERVWTWVTRHKE